MIRLFDIWVDGMRKLDSNHTTAQLCLFSALGRFFLGRLWTSKKANNIFLLLFSLGRKEEEEEEALPLAAHYRTSKLQASPLTISNSTCAYILYILALFFFQNKK
jgi:hypothetical protein